MRQVFSRDSSSLSLLILSESTFCVLWMFHLELVQWFEHDLYCLCMLQFHSDGLCFKILVVCELNWDMQTTKRVKRFRHCSRPVAAEKLRVLAMKVKKVVLVYISLYQSKVEHILQGLVKSSWCRRQWRVGYSTLTINMPVHYRLVEQFFGVTNIREYSNQGQNYHVCCLLTGASRQH